MSKYTYTYRVVVQERIQLLTDDVKPLAVPLAPAGRKKGKMNRMDEKVATDFRKTQHRRKYIVHTSHELAKVKT